MEVRNNALYILEILQYWQNYSLYVVKTDKSGVFDEYFADDDKKMLDLLDELTLEQEGKQFSFKIYLRIRVYYKIYSDDE